MQLSHTIELAFSGESPTVKRQAFKALLMLSFASLSGCSGIPVDRYQAERPEFKMEEYFNGTLDGWGMFQKLDGEVVRRFKVEY